MGGPGLGNISLTDLVLEFDANIRDKHIVKTSWDEFGGGCAIELYFLPLHEFPA